MVELLKALCVKAQGEIYIIVHDGHGIDGEFVCISLLYRFISGCFINPFTAVNKEGAYGVHEALRVFDMWPVLGLFEGV